MPSAGHGENCATESGNDAASPRILVVIASYGEKNLPFLKQIVDTYRKMPFSIDLVVCSEAPKRLDAEVENVVGLPSKNTWTLPFAHKAVFAERVDRYDLFIYSEDDIHATERNIRAFLSVTSQLKDDEIAGFLRYEVEPSGKRFLSEPWNHYHWRADSVRRRGSHTVAEFTNEHAGFYILTKEQLQRAIASGGFVRAPYRARYSWPETAATDPYTSCGFRKVICISEIEDFLVHHMPNPYVHQLDVSFESFQDQLGALFAISNETHPATTLCPVESEHFPENWQKSYYEKSNDVVLNLVPKTATRILSVGCGWGATEETLKKRGAEVTAIPLDSVIAAAAERRGIKVVNGELAECLASLAPGSFDCVVLTNLLHFQKNPARIVTQCSEILGEKGTFVLSGPNFNRLPWLFKRLASIGGFGRLRRFETSGISLPSPSGLNEVFKTIGMKVIDVRWINHSLKRGWVEGTELAIGELTARDWVLRASRLAPALS